MTKRQVKKYVSDTAKKISRSDYVSWIEIIHKNGSEISVSPACIELIDDQSISKKWILVWSPAGNFIYEESELVEYSYGDADEGSSGNGIALAS